MHTVANQVDDRLVALDSARGRSAKVSSGSEAILTSREIAVLRALEGGRPYKEVARELAIALGTLRNHVHQILAKTGTRKLLEAITVVRRAGLLEEASKPAGGAPGADSARVRLRT